MKQIPVKFNNKDGQELGGRLALPVTGKPAATAVFAHCFTCTKNLNAVRNISRALTQNNIAVLQFDFTGLGESEGDFQDTNFSSNVSDLVAAVTYMSEQHQAPSILIGHSLGGAAVIQAAAQLHQINAVVTIGAPADPPHVKHLFADKLQDIMKEGKAQVSIGGRPFTIKRQFIEDLERNPLEEILKKLNKALLILHSPQDRIVDINNAAQIYQAARHPKSFISLDGADHLLSRAEDSIYVGNTIGQWASRYVDLPTESQLTTERQVVVRTQDSYTTDILAGGHALMADEPKSLGGADLGPTPYGLLLASLGACTTITLRMYANHKQWPLEEVKIHLQHEKKHLEDTEDYKNAKSKLDHITKEIELIGDLSQDQRRRLLEIADRCPVHRTLHGQVVVESTLIGD